ncbi:hypothetical protein M0G43_06575 [Subsaxibacter sp. CAU 1640]|uniref:hypothetical protein n=1 Tax=Subsaxibacter sp. CAU 1640 TaxID=2933271 RepID=UPI002004656E|nr:hypothetical protein [Subsaxibacter sp. CAU 1640]MCK7590230.1 hypothetical protein [Subsaxibacter sp. CAU 1640]
MKTDYDCYVLYFNHNDWSFELSESIKVRNPEVHFFGIDRHHALLQTILCKVIHKISIGLSRLFLKHFSICAFANNDKALQLWFKARMLHKKHHFKRVIAHNLGAFYPAVKLARIKSLDLQLDIEDYYPGEALYFNKKYEKQIRMYLMTRSFLSADLITYASEGIRLECEQHFKTKAQAKQVVVINSFDEKDFKKPEETIRDLTKCVWFSQHIGPHRGLEQVFESASRLKHVEFHLIGNLNEAYIQKFTLSSNMLFHPVMEQSELHDFLSRMDIGLALEDPNADYNRNICLTNKILAYAQSGLYILASDTYGQVQFLNSLDYNAGSIIDVSLQHSIECLDINLLNGNSKIERWQKARHFSWEKEQLKLKTLLS